MQARKQKAKDSLADIRCIRREDIEDDVFELWLGISRLMARVHGGAAGDVSGVKRDTASAVP
jgi:hypothetical protein